MADGTVFVVAARRSTRRFVRTIVAVIVTARVMVIGVRMAGVAMIRVEMIRVRVCFRPLPGRRVAVCQQMVARWQQPAASICQHQDDAQPLDSTMLHENRSGWGKSQKTLGKPDRVFKRSPSYAVNIVVGNCGKL